MSLGDFVIGFNYFVLAYFVAISGIYVTLYTISFFEVTDYTRREVFGGLPELFASKYAPPVSVVVPAYNEEATITHSVRSLLTLRYPLHEVVVVNDGSKDGTLEVLMDEYDLYESDRPIRMQVETAPIRGVYTSRTERLTVVDKENGGRSDAQNAGILAASYPFMCMTDADVIMEEDALLRVARPMVESNKVAAVGGIVRIANGCEVERGRVVKVKTSRKPLPNFQVVEYLRAFVASRVGWSKLNCLLIISGAFGMYRRKDIIAAGGLATDTIAEDMELTTRLHKTLKEKDRDYKISFVPDPVIWTEAPESLRVLRRQRDRWHRGLMDILTRYRGLMFNPRYGTVGLIAMPYYLLFEFLGPVIEILGYAAFALGLWLGLLNLQFALLFLLVFVGLGVLLSVTAVFLEELRLRRYERWHDLGKLVLYAILENFGYRQLTSLWRIMAIWSFLRKNTEWGDMERRGFEDPKRSGRELAAGGTEGRERTRAPGR